MESCGRPGTFGTGTPWRSKTLPLERLDGVSKPGDSLEAHRQEGDRLHHFKQEFRTLAEINHPNLIGLHSLEVDAGQWFFTMDLIEGTDFLSYVRPDDVLDEHRLRSAMQQLAQGVMALHAQRIVHRDLKPSNVMVSDRELVAILDFGLVVEVRDQTFSMNRIAGTPAYMAPEQAAGGTATTASDWYAVGVMLYESLSRSRPFDSGNWMEILKLKQTHDATPLSNLVDVPSDLAQLCTGLLVRDPEKRPDALAIAKTLSAHAPTRRREDAAGSQRLVGRETQLVTLQTALQTLRQQKMPQILFITGRSGEGKTSLAEEFLEPLRKQPRLTVLSGRCYDRESVPSRRWMA